MSNRPASRASKPGSDAAAVERVDDTRLAMLRRVKRMTLEERIDLFERLSHDAAWARGARRAR